MATTAWTILAMVGEGCVMNKEYERGALTRDTERERASFIRAVSWLVANQEDDGSFGKKDGADFSIDNATACLALVEVLLLCKEERIEIDLEPKVVRAVRSVGRSLEVEVVPRQLAIAAIIERVINGSSMGDGFESVADDLRSQLKVDRLTVEDPQAGIVLERLGLRASDGSEPKVPWPVAPEQDPLGTLLVALSCYQPRTKPWLDQAGPILMKLWDDVGRDNTWDPSGWDRSLGRMGVSAIHWISLELFLEFCQLRTAALFEEVNAAR